MRASAIKDFSAYEHRVFFGDGEIRLIRRGSERVIERAEEFYIRVATSDVGYRLVFADEGPTHVYSINSTLANYLMRNSQTVED